MRRFELLIAILLIFLFIFGVTVPVFFFAKNYLQAQKLKQQQSIQQYIKTALSSPAENDLKDKIAKLEELELVYPKSSVIKTHLALLYLQDDQFDKAQQKRKALSPTDPCQNIIQAIKLLKTEQNYQEVETLLESHQTEKCNLLTDLQTPTMGISLLAQNKRKEAWQMLSDNFDCSANRLNHFYCIREVSKWYGEVFILEKKRDSQDYLTFKTKQIIMQKGAIKSLNESLKQAGIVLQQQLLRKLHKQKQYLANMEEDLIREKFLSNSLPSQGQLTNQESNI